jgi:hypothetical protein
MTLPGDLALDPAGPARASVGDLLPGVQSGTYPRPKSGIPVLDRIPMIFPSRLTALLLLPSLCPIVQAGVLTVDDDGPAQYSTIAAAVASAVDGDGGNGLSGISGLTHCDNGGPAGHGISTGLASSTEVHDSTMTGGTGGAALCYWTPGSSSHRNGPIARLACDGAKLRFKVRRRSLAHLLRARWAAWLAAAFSTLDQESRRETARLNTGTPSFESTLSTVK